MKITQQQLKSNERKKTPKNGVKSSLFKQRSTEHHKTDRNHSPITSGVFY